MQELSNYSIINSVNQLLFELASGNLSYRINVADDNVISKLGLELNQWAERWQKIVNSQDEIIYQNDYRNIVQNSLVINNQGRILNFSHAFSLLLKIESKELLGMAVTELLTPLSQNDWKVSKKRMSSSDYSSVTLDLQWLTKDKSILPSFCTATKHFNSNKIIISFVTSRLNPETTTLYSNNANINHEAAIIKQLYEFIKENLDQPLPTTKQLAKLFGTNEFNLKRDFRRFFNTSIYQFYNDERLKKAHSLIQKTRLPLKEIAFTCGFYDYVNFSKAFKKKYNYSPSNLDREI